MTGEVVYNTRNTVPSANAYDRYDNTRVLDSLINGPWATVTSRMGAQLKSWSGMEADFYQLLLNSGFETAHLTYVDGSPLTVLRPTQLVDRAGSEYRVKLPATFPLTLTGTWATDAALLVDVGDMSLRQDLSNAVDPLKGSAMLGRVNQVVSSFDALGLLSVTAPSKNAFATACNAANPGYGGGHYRLDVSDSTSPEVKGVCKIALGGVGRWKLIHCGVITIEQMGCVPVAGVNNFTNLQAAIAYGYANNIALSSGSGTFEYGTTLDLSYPGLMFSGAGYHQTIFKYSGTNRAMDSIGTRPNNGTYSIGITLRDFTIEGNSTVSDLLRIRINHCRLSNIRVREASTVFGCGFRIQGTVVGCFDNLICSTGDALMTSRPQNGLVVEADPTDGRRATANTFINPVIEGMTGDGVRFVGCDAAVVNGGTSENHDGVGLSVVAGCQMNTFIALDCEANRGFADIIDSGQSSEYIGCGTTSKFFVDNSAVMTKIEGGWHDLIELGAGAVYTEISRVKVRFFGGALGFKSNGNPFYSFKEVYDVQSGTYIYPTKPVTTVTVTTGTFTYTNNNAFEEWAVISGGTVTQINLNRGAVAGVAVLPISGMFHLAPGDGLTIVSSVAPTYKRIPGGANLS